MGRGYVVARTHNDVDARLTRDARKLFGITSDAGHGCVYHGRAARTRKAEDLPLLDVVILHFKVILEGIGIARELSKMLHFDRFVNGVGNVAEGTLLKERRNIDKNMLVGSSNAQLVARKLP